MSTATVPAVAGQSLVLSGVPWLTYRKMLHLLGEYRVRMTYDHGVLEVMVISSEHERYKHLLGRLIEALSEELNQAIAGFGSMTCSQKRRQRGLEPDECYWIANEPKVRGKDSIKLNVDPPPDLAVEIEVSYSSINRMPIYASLRVPEVWRYDGTTLTFHALQSDQKTYAEIATSLAFPGLTATAIQDHLKLRGQTDENTIVRQFRAWVRQNLTSNP